MPKIIEKKFNLNSNGDGHGLFAFHSNSNDTVIRHVFVSQRFLPFIQRETNQRWIYLLNYLEF